MKYAVIENGIVINIIIANNDYIIESNDVSISENDIINIGDYYNDIKKVFTSKNPTVNIIE